MNSPKQARGKGRRSAKLLEDEDVTRWYENTARGSTVTADVYLRRLAAVCDRLEQTPKDLSGMEEEDLYHLLLDFVSNEEKRGMTGSYVVSSLKAIKSWLAHKGIKLERKIKVRNPESTPTLKDERIPTQYELKKIFLAAIPRDRVSCVLIAHSGVRPEVLGNYKGNDGLTLADLPEMKVEGGKILFDTTPTRIVVRAELSKNGRKYLTFLSTEGCEYLREYLEGRLRNGEKFHEGTDIIHPRYAGKSFITSTNISDGIRKAIRDAGFKWRPYVLRAYFDTQLLLAESQGKITHAYRQFFMGHKGDIESRYTTNKGRLTDEMVKDMREAYKRSQPFLITSNGDNNNRYIPEKLQRLFLNGLGITEEELEGLNLEEIKPGEMQSLMKKKFINLMTGNGGTQKVVLMSEVEQYIAEGWEYIKDLPPDKAIIKVPSLLNEAK